MKTVIVLFTILLCTRSTLGQNEFANHWHLGSRVHIGFDGESATIDEATEMNTFESSFSYSDENGDLLFYGTGGAMTDFPFYESFLWNRNHEVMPNGYLSDSAGCQSTSSGGVIIPDYDNSSLFHIYTTECIENYTANPERYIGLRRTTVDMSLDGGLGDVVVQGVPIYGDKTVHLWEEIGVTRHANGVDYWLVLNARRLPSTTLFYIFHLSPDGITPPIIHEFGDWGSGKVKISPDGTMIAYANGLFDFDNETGNMAFRSTLHTDATGFCFSPNSHYLYGSRTDQIVQYDVNEMDMIPTSQIIFEGEPEAFSLIKDMAIGPDCRIYTSFQKYVDYIGVINDPNAFGDSVNYVFDQLNHPEADRLIFHNYIYSEYNCEMSTEETETGMNTEEISDELIIPNIITPNGDGINDVFTIPYEGIEPYSLLVLNRWGVEVFRSDLADYHWKPASDKGAEGYVTDGVYFYRLAIGPDIRVGHVTVVR